jgi:Prolyl oligopeptidase family/Dipeptidyl peptidase IV (DPP IV) N-terminal region
VRGVDLVDEKNRQIWFHAGGIYPQQDPYFVDFCRINFAGTGLVVLTAGNGTHSIQFSTDRRFIIDACSRVDMPRANKLQRVADGKLICPLERADWAPLLKTGCRPRSRSSPLVEGAVDGVACGAGICEQSNVTNAWKMQGKLLLIVAELDHNVDLASTMQVVNALEKADKDFDFLVIPNTDHGQDGVYGCRRREDFLVRNLLHIEPRYL